MYRLNDIVSDFSTLVGWKDTEIATSDSGLYFQEAHPMLTLRALRGIMPKDLAYKYPVYDSTLEYDKGARVRSGEKVYESLKDENASPVTSVDWKEYDVLTDYLTYITERGIKKVVTKFVNEKVVGMETKNLVDRRTLFDGAGSRDARTENRGRLVGFELTPIRTNGITTTLNKVGVQFIGNTGTVTLYLHLRQGAFHLGGFGLGSSLSEREHQRRWLLVYRLQPSRPASVYGEHQFRKGLEQRTLQHL